MMRIISGFLKGQTIDFKKSSTTRPLKDSVRENIFNILSHSNFIDIQLQNSEVLDLYSGTGSFGIECLSRGAKKIYFVEKDKNMTNLLQKNLLGFDAQKKTIIVNDKIINFLKIKNQKKFDIIFLDPPYAQVEFMNDLKLIENNKIYKKNHVIVIHREKKSKDDLKNVLEILTIRNYGRSKIIFARFLN